MADWQRDDRELLARILAAEAGNQGPVGMTAAGNVIMNRANLPGYGDGVRGVIMKPGQFSPMNSVTGYAGGEQGQNIDAISPSETAYMVADSLLSGEAGDITGGATHFYNPEISNPSWAQGVEFTRIGDHVFGRADAPRGQSSAANTTQRSQPMAQPMQQQQQPRGILEMFGVQKMNPEAQGETALPFYQRPTFSNLMGDLALGFNQMRLRPDEGLAQRIGGRRQQREQQAQTNRTLEYLQQQPGSEAFLEMIRAGGQPAAVLQAYQKSQQPAAMDQTSAMQNYQFLLTQGVDPQAAMERSFGGGGTTINMPTPAGAESDLYEALNKRMGEQFAGFLTSGATSAAAMQDLNVLQELAPLAPSGTVTGRLAEMFPEVSDVAALRESIITRVAPTLRVEGSGSTSDIEYAGMLRSLGSLRNRPEANQAIIGLMQDKAKFNVDRANIVRNLQAGQIDPQEANRQIAELEQSLAIPEKVQNVLRIGGVTSGRPSVNELDDILGGQ